VTVYKIVYAVGLLLAIVAAFVTVPYAPTLLALCGAVAAFSIIPDHHVRVIVSALLLHTVADTFGGIPAVGNYLSMIIGNLGVMACGAAILIVLRNMVARLTG
jgi:hypothetical protein